MAWHPDVPRGATVVLIAVLSVYQRDGRCTVRSVAAEADRNVTTTWNHLRRLRRMGLATWDSEHQATLRPLVGPVPFGER